MRRLIPFLLLAVLAAPAAAQGLGDPLAGRRAQLETQLLRRFARQAGQELRLDAPQRAELARIIETVAAERRLLNGRALDLRRRLALAVRDPATTDDRLEQLLAEQTELRQQEQQLWHREQARLQQVLTPRQRAHFALLWLRLQDEARRVMLQRAPPAAPR